MATNFLVHEKIWFDKFKYDDAERKFYEQMNGPVARTSCQVRAMLGLLAAPVPRIRGPLQLPVAGSLVEGWCGHSHRAAAPRASCCPAELWSCTSLSHSPREGRGVLFFIITIIFFD